MVMNLREQQLLKKRMTKLKAELSTELRLKKDQRKNVNALQKQINTIKSWLQ